MSNVDEYPKKNQDINWELGGDSSGRWIFPEQPEDIVNQYVDFLHRFNCDSPGDKTELWISVDTDFVVWLNGRLIGYGQYPNYPDEKTFERLSLDDAIRDGRNSLAVTVFYNGRDSSVYRRGAPGLVFEIRGQELLAASGTTTLCRPNPCYHSGPIATVSGQLFYTFGYDARAADGFYRDDFTPGDDWRLIQDHEAIVPAHRAQLTPRPVARLADHGSTAATLQAGGVFRREIALAEKSYGAAAVESTRAGLRLADGTLVSAAWLMQHDHLSARSTFSLFESSPGNSIAEMDDGLTPSITELNGDDGVYLVVDLGREEAGHIEFEIEAPAGTVMDIGYGEHFEDLRVRTFVGGRNFAARYICRAGRQHFIHHFQRWAGRYIAVHIQTAEFKLYQIHLRRRDYPVKHRGRLATGNPLQTKIHNVARRTLHLCMHEHYEDTPWREQALYANDARIQALCGYYAFGETAFPASSFTLLGKGLRDDGFLALTAPARPRLTIPSFTFAWMLAVRDHYLYSGDDSVARQFLPQMIAMLEAFLNERRDGLLPLRRTPGIWHFYDWSGGMSGYSKDDFAKGLTVDAPLNCFLVLALDAVREILGWCGQETDQSKLQTAAEEIRHAIAARFWDPEAGVFRTHEYTPKLTALTQALAVLAGAGTDAQREQVLERMNREDSQLTPAGLSQSFYTFQARMLRKDLFGAQVLADIEATWGKMLWAGATTFWETINGAADFYNAGSLCHGWSAVPLYVYYQYLLGIRPLEPGFRSFAIDPVKDYVTTCAGTVPVPDGDIALKWSRDGGKAQYYLYAPSHCHAQLLDPDGVLIAE